ncbi:hypothetical protein G4B88_018937 [Cannabis sativa]|uniref:NAD-dependent epimerase/dehydratase domain-containing protein n=1 Tax=Cannabis sativa TaxID=3483 RepID=A0A7J6H1Y7_CANSA|nr:hypothetical protein G4B88_018937 [Cannabis sativa]
MASTVVEKARKVVCVTGAGGFIASSLIKLLLSNDYIVHGTVRQLNDAKYAHLNKLDKASENLKLFKADLLDYGSLVSAIHGCSGVFHVASPVPPASVPNPENWYCLSKTLAESEAWEFSKKTGLDVVAICPTLVFGPILQSNVNSSTLVLLKLLKEGYDSIENRLRVIVDVRDVADAILMGYEKPEAEGRYICTSHLIKAKDLVDKLKSLYPNYNYPKKFTEVENDLKLSSEKLQKLGWSSRPLNETLIDSIESYRAAGLLD